jgi:FPC/CPF motif-containing protein YcgG
MKKEAHLTARLVRDMTGSFAPSVVKSYLPILDAKAFKKVEKDLATVKDLAKQMVNFLKLLDADIPDVGLGSYGVDDATEYSKFVERHVIEGQYFRTGFYWGRKFHSSLRVIQ